MPTPHRLHRWLCRCLIPVACLLACYGEANGQKIGVSRHARQRTTLLSEFHSETDKLIRLCEGRNQTRAVQQLQAWKIAPEPEELIRRPLAKHVTPDLPAGLSESERDWQIRLKRLRGRLANDLYRLSRRALKDNQPTTAWQTLRESLHYDPDLARGRRIFGYVRNEDQWVTPFAAQMLRRKYVWHEKFGWLPDTHVERYENGQRYHKGRWISADREAEIRRAFRNAWRVQTDHYLVRTNVSLEKGVELALKLESFHTFFRHTFASFFETPEQLRKVFDGTAQRKARSNPYEVHFFRSRQEYIDRLIKDNPQIEITNGIYVPKERIAFFFDNPEVSTTSTLTHEATHQILYELHSQPRMIGEKEHFWIVEGIACYMESFKQTPRGIVVGDPDYDRFYAARYRLLKDAYYVPLARFTSMGRLPFQTHPRIQMNYSQASGLVHFFMHYDGGRYRDALIQHLSLLYRPARGRVRVAGLDTLTAVPYDELDAQYRAWAVRLEEGTADRQAKSQATQAVNRTPCGSD